MVLEVLGQPLTGVEALLQLGVGDVTGHDHGAAERQTGADGELRERLADLAHGTVEVDVNDVVVEHRVGHLGQELRRVVLELLDEHTIAGDLAEGLTIGGARDGDRDGA